MRVLSLLEVFLLGTFMTASAMPTPSKNTPIRGDQGTSRPSAVPKPTGEDPDVWNRLEITTYERYEQLQDRELRLGGLTRDDHTAKWHLENRIKKHRNDFLDDHNEGVSSRRELERKLLQDDISLRVQQIEDLKSKTWREAKIELLVTEIGELVAWKNNYHISKRPPGRILEDKE